MKRLENATLQLLKYFIQQSFTYLKYFSFQKLGTMMTRDRFTKRVQDEFVIRTSATCRLNIVSINSKKYLILN